MEAMYANRYKKAAREGIGLMWSNLLRIFHMPVHTDVP